MWHRKKKIFISHPPPPSSGVGCKVWPKQAWEPRGYPQGCPGDACFPGVIHFVEEVLGIIHVLHPVVFMVSANQEVWVGVIGEEVWKTSSPRYCEHGLSLNCTWRTRTRPSE